jgi:hypothetical protein
VLLFGTGWIVPKTVLFERITLARQNQSTGIPIVWFSGDEITLPPEDLLYSGIGVYQRELG